MDNWKITSRNYVQSAELLTKHFEFYVSKNEHEKYYWLRIYNYRRIFSDYIEASSIKEACEKANKRITEFLKEEIEILNLLEEEWSELNAQAGSVG